MVHFHVLHLICFNLVGVRPLSTPYELFKGRRSVLSHLKVFGCRCFILNNGKESLGKFDAKADKGVFLGYATQIHAYRVCNKRLMTVEESMHVVFDETNPKLQDQVSKNTNEEDLLQEQISTAEKSTAAGNQLAERKNSRLKKLQTANCPRTGSSLEVYQRTTS